MKSSQIKELTVTNFTYVHDPLAMKKWISLYVEMFKNVLEFEEVENTKETKHKH